MKTVVKEISYEKLLKEPFGKIQNPIKPNHFWRWLMKTVGQKELHDTNFKYNSIGMEKLPKNQPCLILMNHSCFLDLSIVQSIFYPRPINIVCTSDGFIGKNWLMRQIGCIPTNKFVPDFLLLKHMKYALGKLKSNVLMYPEASYSFDGCATPLPETIGKCIKLLNVPVVMIRTYGAFSHNPLYNNLQLRKVNVTADVKYLLSQEDINQKSTEEINAIITKEFTFDNWKWQQENQIKVSEPFRADSLNRVLYKCQCCETEGKMEGKGIELTCKECGAKWTLSEYGVLEAVGEHKNEKFNHVPQWASWQRQKVREEIEKGTYKIETDVEIYIMKNTKALYKVGTGHLVHDVNGFMLNGCDGKLHYEQKPLATYSLYSDYYWYEIGDMICIGDLRTSYYCFPTEGGDIVSKARIATEELYKLQKK